MPKYKFYKNRITRYHPSIQIDEDEKTWKNLEVTSSPRKNDRYIKLKKNPSPTFKGDSYVRKHIRIDPIRTRGELLKKICLSEEDLQQIEEYLFKNKK